MKEKKFSLKGPVIELIMVVVIGLLIWIFVDVSVESILEDEAGSCISVIFDKPRVKGADRIVVYQNNQVVADISDPEPVRQIARLFTVANRTDLCDYEGGWRMEIYNGDRLVREVVENCCCGFYLLYEWDLLHWVFPSESGIGQLQLSPEDEQWLRQTITQYQNK